VDALTGPRIGRPKSACYRTVDVVGIDTLAHVVHTKREQLRQDPWHGLFKLPTWIEKLIQEGALGQKSGRGLYKKEGKDILVLDYATGQYRKTDSQIDPGVEKILALRQPAEKFAALIQCPHPQAQLLWATFRDVFHYSAVHLHEIADNARDLDLAMRWGFGWSHGPFELWQAAGWAAIGQAIEADRKAGKTLSDAALPDWCLTPTRTGVHQPDGSWAPAIGGLRSRSHLEVYRRQLFPELLVGEQAKPSTAPISQTAGETLYQNKEVRLWRLPDIDAGIGILSFASTMHAVSDEVLAGMMASIAMAETELDGLVLWHEPPFCVGANLKQVAQACKAGEFTRLEQIVAQFQAASQALKYARVPTVAVTQGLALGGGCEFLMHAQQRVMLWKPTLDWSRQVWA
jgi:3-hydroxyacyl-CoA dehydrogenase